MGTEEVMGLPGVEWMTCEDLGRRGWDGETVLRTMAVVSRTVPHVTRRAGDVNPPVTVRARAARTATGTHEGLTGRLTSTARLALSVQGVSTEG
jgi:hypothetical protein